MSQTLGFVPLVLFAVGACNCCGIQGRVDIFSAGAAETTANRSVILDIQVEDVDEDRFRPQASSEHLSWTDQP